MVNLVFSDEVLENLVERVFLASERRISERRVTDETGRVLLTKAEASKAMGVSPATLDRWRAKGLPCVRVTGGKPMYRPEALRAWAAEQESNGG